ncbi:carboxypeptidase-like regulatory domain-containing protein [Niabella ginsengisoli]|uniref:Carboxypeptidase-like regulatory domain-containing protein n=1 Tax=Niabella ginsengisoli TaxID=522298 RepID=A0ABS9SHE9_9BACT|nr:carboxypeptidase-like regulatory domain-containing protein [Niabella ginsengisoli]MCH5597794.1 carboxypeptidase-like regulatory domain-containing protein [Niabella ginsengisoli]
MLHKRFLAILLCLIFGYLSSFAQARLITGRVTDDATNEPIQGANITLSGTNLSVQSDAGGNFTIEADLGSVLKYSYVGYESGEINVSRSTVEIRLKKSASNLEQVIVVGYGTQKKKAITGAILQ